MSFIALESMGIQLPNIMADSVDSRQMLLTLVSRCGWPIDPGLCILVNVVVKGLHKRSGLGRLGEAGT